MSCRKQELQRRDLDAWYLLEFDDRDYESSLLYGSGSEHESWKHGKSIKNILKKEEIIFHCSILQEVRNLWGLNFW